MHTITRSLADLLGQEYIDRVCAAWSFLSGTDKKQLLAIGHEQVDFFSPAVSARQDELLTHVGQTICDPITGPAGAATAAFSHAQNDRMSPLAGFGFIRVGQDGRAYFIGKSEHYHASLGHHFPGYALLDKARAIGITNVTHNNTRGHVTRLLERELIRVANGLSPDDPAALDAVLASEEPHVLNRVINLETGSLAVEAALKMMLARFYRLDTTYDTPVYAGRTPVLLVMGDYQGGKAANYHGTTILTQILRGMWPDLADGLETHNLYRVVPVAINDPEDFAQKVDTWDRGANKIAGFFHELVLMNYGGIRLKDDYLNTCHALCREHDIPIMIDEIQSCMWSPELFLFKEYHSRPDFVSVGKGFPGGLYPASRILTTAAMDSLNQFGALVTNGQEELASLAYLVTMAFAQANAEHTRTMGRYYHDAVTALARRYDDLITNVEGYGHLTTIYFRDAETTMAFTGIVNKEYCIDISAQTYKANCPPAALTKLPLIVGKAAIDFVIGRMDQALERIQ